MNIHTPEGTAMMVEVLRLRETGMTITEMEAELKLPAGAVRNMTRNYRRAYPGLLRSLTVPPQLRNSVTPWSPECVQLLRDHWDTPMERSELLEKINGARPAGSKPTTEWGVASKARLLGLQLTAARIGEPSEAVEPSDASWIAAAGVPFFDDIPDPDGDRYEYSGGIMRGRPPDLDRMLEARAQMARQGRMAVVDVGVRGLV